ncbi:MAG: hypothetical protein ACOC2M_00535 [bacterium]
MGEKIGGGFSTYDPFNKKNDIKSTLIFLMANITLNARNNGRAILHYNQLSDLLGWGSEIENFDSIVSVMLIDDEDYKLKRKKFKHKISEQYRLHRGESMGRWKIKEYYTQWFRLICNKLTAFEVYPEITEEDIDAPVT